MRLPPYAGRMIPIEEVNQHYAGRKEQNVTTKTHKPKMTVEQIKSALNLYNQGYRPAEIARRLGIHPVRVSDILLGKSFVPEVTKILGHPISRQPGDFKNKVSKGWPRLAPDKVAEIRELRKQGSTYRDIKIITGVSEPSIKRIVHSYDAFAPNHQKQAPVTGIVVPSVDEMVDITKSAGIPDQTDFIKPLTDADRFEIAALREAGESISDIATTYGVSKKTIYNISKWVRHQHEGSRNGGRFGLLPNGERLETEQAAPSPTVTPMPTRKETTARFQEAIAQLEKKVARYKRAVEESKRIDDLRTKLAEAETRLNEAVELAVES